MLGGGELDLCVSRVGKIEPEVLGFKCFFFIIIRAPKSLTALNTCLDEMEEFKGRDMAFVSDWLTKKVFKCVFKGGSSKEYWLLNAPFSYYSVNTIWYVFTPQFHC